MTNKSNQTPDIPLYFLTDYIVEMVIEYVIFCYLWYYTIYYRVIGSRQK